MLHAEQRFAAALAAPVEDPPVRALPPTGPVDRFVESTDVPSLPESAQAVTNALFA